MSKTEGRDQGVTSTTEAAVGKTIIVLLCVPTSSRSNMLLLKASCNIPVNCHVWDKDKSKEFPRIMDLVFLGEARYIGFLKQLINIQSVSINSKSILELEQSGMPRKIVSKAYNFLCRTTPQNIFYSFEINFSVWQTEERQANSSNNYSQGK